MLLLPIIKLLGSVYELGFILSLQVPELLLGLGSETAVIYYEQGHEWLFGDMGGRVQSPATQRAQQQQQQQQGGAQPHYRHASESYDGMESGARTNVGSGTERASCVATAGAEGTMASWGRVFHMVMGLPVIIASVSEPVRSILSIEFGRGQTLLLPNGIDVIGEEGFRPLSTSGEEGSGAFRETASIEAGTIEAPLSPCRVMMEGVSSLDDIRCQSTPWMAAGLPMPTQMFGRFEVSIANDFNFMALV